MVKRAEGALKNADNSGNDFEKRLASLHRALLSAIFSKGGVKGESLTGMEAIEMLEKSGVDSETALEGLRAFDKNRIRSLRWPQRKRIFGRTVQSRH